MGNYQPVILDVARYKGGPVASAAYIDEECYIHFNTILWDNPIVCYLSQVFRAFIRSSMGIGESESRTDKQIADPTTEGINLSTLPLWILHKYKPLAEGGGVSIEAISDLQFRNEWTPCETNDQGWDSAALELLKWDEVFPVQ